MRGLVLEGGGVKGAYHIGVLTALREEGLADFDGYVGTSIGAINSAMLAAGDWDKTLALWNNINVQNVLDMDENNLKRIFKGQFDVELLGNVGKLVSNLGGFIDTTTDKMREYFKAYIDEAAIRKSSKEFGLVTFSVPDFEPHYMMKEDIPEGLIYDYVMASAAYPAFKWQKIEGNEDKWFIDGGVYDNMPVNMLSSRNYDEIVVIRTNIRKTFGTRKVANTGNAKLTFYTPSEKMELAIKFTRENIDKYMEMGYYDAKRNLMKLPSNRFCIHDISEADFDKFIEGINPEAFREITVIEKLKPHKCEAANLEDFFDSLREELDMPDATNSAVMISFLELFGALFRVNRFRFYTLPEFYDRIMYYAYEESKSENGDVTEVLKGEHSINSELKEIFVSLYNHYDFTKGE